ncbi:tyrosine-type recombinase/integrase [Burkholderia multivorans]|uniref:tyrosine-type recombinase/integrase n=1 Tax=Burkholderia multivorans TaxID=87883 RepID=UPI00018E3D8C|nr:tyrosine-type recombinase/integrase [Burkholderia multivorans]EED96868.1 phage integrase [Burkholderia multivorans CGD1]
MLESSSEQGVIFLLMVQKPVQKRVQSKKPEGSPSEDFHMPRYMSKAQDGTGYVFRRVIPEPLRPIIGKGREFKIKLGGDYRAACLERDRLAHESSQRIEAARQSLAALRTNRFGRWDELEVIREVTPELSQRFYCTVLATVDIADTQRRESMSVGIEPGLTQSEVQDSARSIAPLLKAVMRASTADEARDAIKPLRPAAHQMLHLNGYRLADELLNTPHEGRLLFAFVRAHLKGLDLLEARFHGEDPPVALAVEPLKTTVAVASSPASVPMATGGLMLSQAIKDFLKDWPSAKSAQLKKLQSVLPAFLSITGDLPISQLRQLHIKEFLALVQKLPPRWQDVKKERNVTIQQISEQKWPICLSKATYDGSYIGSLNLFIRYGVTNWQDIGFPTTLSTAVPYQGERTKLEYKQRALRPNEIRMIFFSEKMKKIVKSPAKVYKFWLLALELYTGGRVRELCQINPQSDWGCKDGIWWLTLTNESGPLPDPDVIKRVKTKKPRTIPMHKDLVRLGFPVYLEQLKESGARRLFPEWATKDGDAGAYPGKWVQLYMREIGLHGVANAVGNSIRGSHAFRHTLLTYGRKAGVNLRCISGHAEKSDNVVADGYEDETVLVTLEDMAVRLGKLDFGVELPMPVQRVARPVERRKAA